MIMKALQEDIDDLDRMVDTGAQKDAIRSQIRLISREVAALETDYARLAAEHSKCNQAAAEGEARANEEFRQQALRAQEIYEPD